MSQRSDLASTPIIRRFTPPPRIRNLLLNISRSNWNGRGLIGTLAIGSKPSQMCDREVYSESMSSCEFTWSRRERDPMVKRNRVYGYPFWSTANFYDSHRKCQEHSYSGRKFSCTSLVKNIYLNLRNKPLIYTVILRPAIGYVYLTYPWFVRVQRDLGVPGVKEYRIQMREEVLTR